MSLFILLELYEELSTFNNKVYHHNHHHHNNNNKEQMKGKTG
jgi:hypothetical protein